MAQTLAAEQAEIETAITAILTGGQSITINGRTITRANLSELYKRREFIAREIDRASTRGRTVAEF